MKSRVIALAILSVFAASAAPPEFEVAVVKAANPSNGAMPQKERFLPGGQVEIPNGTIRQFMMAAYGVREDLITGGPKWLDSDRFDIVAKTPPDTSIETLRLMLQSLLAERFKLAIHREDKVMPTYELVVAKGGSKLQPSPNPGRQTCAWSVVENGLRRRECHNMTMAELAAQLPGWGGIGIDRPVVDLTELKGAYDFQLEVGLPARRKAEAGRPGEPVPADDPGPTIFNAMTQIGLKLESRKRAVPVIVIDHVERVPLEN